MLVPLSPSRRSQSCASRAKSRSKFARTTRACRVGGRLERLTQSQKVADQPRGQLPKLDPVRAMGRRTMMVVELPAADDRLLRQSAGLLAELAARQGITSVHLTPQNWS